jgi:hypothetical protein
VNNTSVHEAMAWILRHMQDPDFDDPVQQVAPGGGAGRGGGRVGGRELQMPQNPGEKQQKKVGNEAGGGGGRRKEEGLPPGGSKILKDESKELMQVAPGGGLGRGGGSVGGGAVQRLENPGEKGAGKGAAGSDRSLEEDERLKAVRARREAAAAAALRRLDGSKARS